MANYSRGIDTHQTLLETSLDLFSQKGYDATSVAEICHKARVSKGAFYHHFPSKQDLFLALMSDWLEQVEGMLKVVSSSVEDVPAALDSMAATTGSIFDELEGGFPILLEFWRQACREPVIWKQVVEPYHHYLDFFINMIQMGIDQGSMNASLDPELGARILMAVAMGLLIQASFDPDGANWQEVTQSGINIFLRGIRRMK